MKRLEFLLFGYIEYSLENPRELINLALRSGRTAVLTKRGNVTLSLPTARRLRADIARLGATPVGIPRGIGGIIYAIPTNIPTAVALLISLLIYFYSSDLVFDVRVSGNEAVSEEQILNELSAAGFGVGSRWSKTDKSAVELSVLSSSDTLAWISINEYGRIAYVTVIELDAVPKEEITYSAANIVATRDCVIEEITVTSGTPVVRVGDTVRAGDLLISGIIESEGGTEYVVAEGIVRGSTSERVSTEIPREITESFVREGALESFSVKIFNFNINILQSYGNLPEGCVIIEEKRNITLFGRRLPVSFIGKRCCEPYEITRTLSDAELPIMAAVAHNADVNSALSGRDLLSIRTSGGFTDVGYKMESLVVYSTEVGSVIEIKTEENSW